MPFDKSQHIFKKNELINILESSLNKTLGEIDIKGDFERTKTNHKITGIAGDVVEHSLLGYSSDQRQDPDIIVDGIKTEVKTTGIRYSKSDAKKGKYIYEAKEPVSITAVSPDKIVKEEFDDSNFWHKLKHLLLIYYHYDSFKTVPASAYANFILKGYDFHEFALEDRLRLKSDWLMVRNFIRILQNNYETPEAEYPRISHDLRSELVYIDTAPKWPNPPRFRLKRSFVTKLVKEHFGEKLEQLPQHYSRYSDIDKKCNEITRENKNLTIRELMQKYNIVVKDVSSMSKAICERIIIKMFGGKATKLNKIALFNDFNIIGKSVIVTEKDTRTEDMKLFPIDFNEWCDTNKAFEESVAYDYFANHQFLCIIFKETVSNPSKEEFLNNRFIGFKRISFDDCFINDNVLSLWEEIRHIISSDLLKETICYDKNNNPIINPCGTVKKQLNFPKSKDNLIFVRGSGIDSTKKNHCVNGINMYQQWIWIKGKYIADRINQRGNK